MVRFPAGSLEEPRKAMLKGLLWRRGWRSSDWDRKVFRGPPVIPFSLATAYLTGSWRRGPKACLPLKLIPLQEAPKPAGTTTMQSTHPGIHSQAAWLTESWEHPPPHPTSPRPQLCLSSAGGGPASFVLSQSPRISFYKSTCGPVSSVNRV